MTIRDDHDLPVLKPRAINNARLRRTYEDHMNIRYEPGLSPDKPCGMKTA
jgi:hypothetical protein